jgi:hypothetical protein
MSEIPAKSMRPEELMAELGIKKSAFYNDLSYLQIRLEKDTYNKPYVTFEQIERIRELREHINETGQRAGFDEELDHASAMVKAENNSLTMPSDDEIYVEPSAPEENLNLDKLMRKASELKAREIAMPDLVTRAVADKLTEEDLPEDLREKVEAVRESVNPKWTPEGIADNLLAQWRSQKRA